MEGIVQKAYKATYPPDQAKEDWEIINDLSQYLKRRKIFENKNVLISNMFNYIKSNSQDKSLKIDYNFYEEEIFYDHIDYYYSNVVSRSSKTMSECRSARNIIKKTGTEG